MNREFNRKFTGRRMTAILVIGFAIVAAVNFLMASFAVSGFGGVIVENSYVASQKFNGWLDEAEQVRALGWDAAIAREAHGYVTVETASVPAGAVVTAKLRRPLGEQELRALTFTDQGSGTYRSNQTIGSGRWTVRLSITADDQNWAMELPLS